MMEHWLLDCPALPLTRMEIFGRHDLNLHILATSPKQVIALARANTHSLSALWHVPSSTTTNQAQRTSLMFFLFAW